MADEEWTDIKVKSKVLVTVEDVLPDIIVVSFHSQGKLFQGVLLDSKKKLLPCGIIPPPHLGPPLGTASLPLEDKLFSASQRYSYFQEKATPVVDRLQAKRDIRPPARFKNARMTVRLRPRQVLCSKCRGICNENSENVDVSSKKKKNGENESSKITPVSKTNPRPERRLRSSGEISPRPVFPDNPRAQPKKGSNADAPPAKKKRLAAHLVPKVKTIWSKEEEESSVHPLVDEDKPVEVVVAEEEDPLSLPDGAEVKGQGDDPTASGDDSPVEESDPLDITGSRPQRLLRKKRSVGSMEDLWDENVFEDASKVGEKKAQGKTKTPVIKISFGSGTGEGTVLEIPAKPQTQDIPSESENEEKKREKTKRDASAKAAKKALKKAKKEARRKLVEGASPARVGCTSPRYPSMSPRYFTTIMSPRQNLGNSSPAYEIFHKKHKHKVKHKKRHKEEKKHKEGQTQVQAQVVEDGSEESEGIKECLKQKLSISLKRLNSNAYMRRSGSGSGTDGDASDEHSDVDAVPDFPGSGSAVMVRLSTQTLTSCQTSDGRSMTVGDVVWGKIHGFPWWPGKVLSITVSRKEDGCSSPQAHVSWYGSSTSSLMSCDQLNPFLETFQMRYNKKKRGPYKEAIKQATTEARRGDVHLTTSAEIFSSPTQVDVVS